MRRKFTNLSWRLPNKGVCLICSLLKTGFTVHSNRNVGMVLCLCTWTPPPPPSSWPTCIPSSYCVIQCQLSSTLEASWFHSLVLTWILCRTQPWDLPATMATSLLHFCPPPQKKKKLLMLSLCSSRKNPYPPHGRSLEIPRKMGS